MKLLRKELWLASSPLIWLFLLFTGLTLLPGYPLLVGPLFVCPGLFYYFYNTRESNDLLYSALLPLRRSDAVRGKLAFVCLYEGLAFALIAVLTILRMTVLCNDARFGDRVLMPPNPAFLGFVLLMFALFNALFVNGFFRRAQAVAKPFLMFLPAGLLLIVAEEMLPRLPGLAVLRERGVLPLILQCLVLAGGAGVYGLLTRKTLKQCVTAFERMEF